MVARSQKKIIKAHELNKRVRREKARLRARGPKKHELKPSIIAKPRVHVKLDADAKIALQQYCVKHNVKPYKACQQILRMMINKDWQKLKEQLKKEEVEGLLNGVQA